MKKSVTFYFKAQATIVIDTEELVDDWDLDVDPEDVDDETIEEYAVDIMDQSEECQNEVRETMHIANTHIEDYQD